MARLNAAPTLRVTERIGLATQLYPSPASRVVDADELEPAANDLLASLLEAGLIEDSAETFEHLHSGGLVNGGGGILRIKERNRVPDPRASRSCRGQPAQECAGAEYRQAGRG
jgi:hypothetical protein